MVENYSTKKMRHQFGIGLIFILSMPILYCGCASQSDSMPAVGVIQTFGNPVIKRGMNLGNALDSPVPGEWGISIQPEYFEVIKNAGFDTVRIPVRFSAHADITPPYLVDPDFMLLVDSIVHQGLSAGLTVILDMHHYDEIMLDPVGQRERFLALWDQLAVHFKKFPANLYFEILNEPNQYLDANTWNALSTDCIQVIRASNPKRQILVGGVDYNSINSLDLLSLPSDGNLMAVFHLYLPFEFTHQGASWVEGSNEWVGTTWDATLTKKQVITEQLDRAADWSARNQIPLVMTEFGSISSADAASRQKWTAFLAQEAENRNLGWVYWEFCSEFGVYDCEQKSWDQEMLKALTDH
jgi:endoglucanase